jgi:hypothetical protein
MRNYLRMLRIHKVAGWFQSRKRGRLLLPRRRQSLRRAGESCRRGGPPPRRVAARARDSGGAIAPTTIHTYRKATVFGRIVAEILFYRVAVKKIGAESPVFFARLRAKKTRPNSLYSPIPGFTVPESARMPGVPDPLARL